MGGVSREYPPARKEAWEISSLCLLRSLLGKKVNACLSEQCVLQSYYESYLPKSALLKFEPFWFLAIPRGAYEITAFRIVQKRCRHIPFSHRLHIPSVVFGACFWILWSHSYRRGWQPPAQPLEGLHLPPMLWIAPSLEPITVASLGTVWWYWSPLSLSLFQSSAGQFYSVWMLIDSYKAVWPKLKT